MNETGWPHTVTSLAVQNPMLSVSTPEENLSAEKSLSENENIPVTSFPIPVTSFPIPVIRDSRLWQGPQVIPAQFHNVFLRDLQPDVIKYTNLYSDAVFEDFQVQELA